jgi:hypothetical protein
LFEVGYLEELEELALLGSLEWDINSQTTIRRMWMKKTKNKVNTTNINGSAPVI